MLIGIMLGHFLPGMKEALNHLEYVGIYLRMAVLLDYNLSNDDEG